MIQSRLPIRRNGLQPANIDAPEDANNTKLREGAIRRQPEAAAPSSRLTTLETEAIVVHRGIRGSDAVTACAWHGAPSQRQHSTRESNQ